MVIRFLFSLLQMAERIWSSYGPSQAFGFWMSGNRTINRIPFETGLVQVT